MQPDNLALNCSLALGEVPPRDRAATLGYTAVEFSWPFATQNPAVEEVRTFVDDVHRAELPAVLLNFPGGGPTTKMIS